MTRKSVVLRVDQQKPQSVPDYAARTDNRGFLNRIHQHHMILIFSDQNDYSTVKVMEYLFYMNEQVFRINREDTVDAQFHIDVSNQNCFEIEFVINGKPVSMSQVKSIWFRRGGFYFREIGSDRIKKYKKLMKRQINSYLSEEQITLNNFIYEHLLSNGNWKVLGNPMVMNTRKLSVLRMASRLGLNIPRTLITTKRSDLINFINENEEVITKGIQDNFTPFTVGTPYTCWTEVIDMETAETFQPEFFPSLFQEKIEKLFEIRIFYLDGQFYSIAIFSQESAKTQVDFRNYDFEMPNRKAAIDLPESLKKQLSALLQELQLNTASLDLIYTKSQEFVFLEINPVGQYDMVGKYMNFQLDKKIALWLARKKV